MHYFFLDNHRKYIEKAIKPIAEAIYRDMTKHEKEKRNRLREIEEENMKKKRERNQSWFVTT